MNEVRSSKQGKCCYDISDCDVFVLDGQVVSSNVHVIRINNKHE